MNLKNVRTSLIQEKNVLFYVLEEEQAYQESF